MRAIEVRQLESLSDFVGDCVYCRIGHVLDDILAFLGDIFDRFATMVENRSQDLLAVIRLLSTFIQECLLSFSSVGADIDMPNLRDVDLRK